MSNWIVEDLKKRQELHWQKLTHLYPDVIVYKPTWQEPKEETPVCNCSNHQLLSGLFSKACAYHEGDKRD